MNFVLIFSLALLVPRRAILHRGTHYLLDRGHALGGFSEAIGAKKRTLTNLYNARPTWLARARDHLDRAAFAAYVWTPDLFFGEILTNLPAPNLERAEGQLRGR